MKVLINESRSYDHYTTVVAILPNKEDDIYKVLQEKLGFEDFDCRLLAYEGRIEIYYGEELYYIKDVEDWR